VKWITKLAFSWGAERLRSVNYNPYPSVNILHASKMGRSSNKPGHKILCYDPPVGRHRDFEIAWRMLPKRQRECVECRFVTGSIIWDDGNMATWGQLTKGYGHGLNKAAFKSNVQYGLRRIEYVIEK